MIYTEKIITDVYECIGADIDYATVDFSIFAKDKDRVAYFLSLFLNSEFFEKIIIINSKKLKNGKKFKFKFNESYRIVQHVEDVQKNVVIDACTSHGGFLIIFVPKETSRLMKEYISKGWYLHKGQMDLMSVLFDEDHGKKFISCLSLDDIKVGQLFIVLAMMHNFFMKLKN